MLRNFLFWLIHVCRSKDDVSDASGDEENGTTPTVVVADRFVLFLRYVVERSCRLACRSQSAADQKRCVLCAASLVLLSGLCCSENNQTNAAHPNAAQQNATIASWKRSHFGASPVDARRSGQSQQVRRTNCCSVLIPLASGVLKYGKGKWAEILATYDFGDRTSVDLKDKWRNLEKAVNRARQADK